MPSRWASPGTNGIVTCRHAEPSQWRISPWRSHRPSSDHSPAAHASSGATASTVRISLSAVPGLGVGTAVQANPSQCSISVREPNPPLGPQDPLRHENPPAHASSGPVASTASRPLPWAPGLGTPEKLDQPFGPRWRTSGRTAPFVETAPTAQTSCEPVAATDRSSANPPSNRTVPPGTGSGPASEPRTSTWSVAGRGTTPCAVVPATTARYFAVGTGSPFASSPSHLRRRVVDRLLRVSV